MVSTSTDLSTKKVSLTEYIFFSLNKNKMQKAVEACDSLQCFLVLHSLGGGTGSGVGSYIVGLLEDNYKGVFRFNGSVFPSKDDDVVVSPYNSLLSLNELIEHSDCVLPIDNQALLNICKNIENPVKGKS
jgi:tubulin epsilon